MQIISDTNNIKPDNLDKVMGIADFFDNALAPDNYIDQEDDIKNKRIRS